MSKDDTRRIGVIPAEIQTENETKRRLPDIRVILLGAGILLLLMLIGFLTLVHQLQQKAPVGTFTYERESIAVFDGSALENGTAVAFRRGMASVTEQGFFVFDQEGTEKGVLQVAYERPFLISGERVVLACDLGGTGLTMMDYRGSVVLNVESEGELLDADLHGKAVCYAELQPDYKTVITVYDEKQNQIYRWYSASRYMNQCAISSDAKRLCAVALGEEHAQFESTAVLFETDLEEPVCEVSLGDQLILDLRFLDNQTLCAIGEMSALLFTTDGVILAEYRYTEPYLHHYSVSDDGFIVLVLNKYQAGNANTIVTLNDRGEVLSERYLGEEILAVSTAGKLFSVQTPDTFYVYDKELNLCAAQAASASVLCSDGSAILLEDGIGVRYVPQ